MTAPVVVATADDVSALIQAVLVLVLLMGAAGGFVGSFCGDLVWLVRGWFRRRRRFARMQRRGRVRA